MLDVGYRLADGIVCLCLEAAANRVAWVELRALLRRTRRHSAVGPLPDQRHRDKRRRIRRTHAGNRALPHSITVDAQINGARADAYVDRHRRHRAAVRCASAARHTNVGRWLGVRPLPLSPDAAAARLTQDLVAHRWHFLFREEAKARVLTTRARQRELRADDDQQDVASGAIR